MPAPPIRSGWDYGQGLALRKEPGPWHAAHWHIYTSTFIAGTPNREPILVYELPDKLSGAATYVQTVGEIPHYGQMSGDSLFIDDASNRLCISSGSWYTTANGKNTLACAEIDTATGKLRPGAQSWGFQVCDGSGACQPRPDRMTQSGMLRVPSEALATKLKGHYIVGFGGMYSVTNGQSMGLAGCAFDLPPQSYVGKITCTPVVGYPHDQPGATFMNRDADYVQVQGFDDNPQRGSDAVARYGSGKFAPQDGLSGMAADIIDLPGASAFVGFAEMQRGCIGYGDNFYNLPPIASDGSPVKPTATNVSTGVVRIPAEWQTGQMVSIVGTTTPARRRDSGGLIAGLYYVYFLRRVGDHAYSFHATPADALDDSKAPITLKAAITAGVRPVVYCQAPSKPYPYPQAAVGSQGARHYLYFYNLDDLATVASGAKAQNAIQPASFAPLELPDITYPTTGMNARRINGAQWIPDLARFAVAWSDITSTRQGRRVAFYPVNVQQQALPPKPTTRCR
jgi:hypothetical protein